MPRAIWTGSLSFGLVNVPVGLFAATDDKAIHFNQFQAGTPDRSVVERVTQAFDERIKVVFVQQRVDPLIERMGGGRWQVGGGHPQLVLPFSLASGSHGHVRSRVVQPDRFWLMIESSRTDRRHRGDHGLLSRPCRTFTTAC